MIKNKIIFILLLTFLILPGTVYANIICNDGTESKTCGDCHRGCCSGHEGCTSNPNVIYSLDDSITTTKTTTTTRTNYNNVSSKETEAQDTSMKQIYLFVSICISVSPLYFYNHYKKTGGVQ